jgi:hypothetical protein
MLTPEVFVSSPAGDEPGPVGQLEPEVLLRDHQGPVKDVLDGQDLPGADEKRFFHSSLLSIVIKNTFFSTQAHCQFDE